MASLSYLIGDATSPEGQGPKVIVHCCNDIGGWGSGFVLALNRRWREPEVQYRKWHQTIIPSTPFKLGEVQFVKVEEYLWVSNLIGQHKTIQTGEKKPVRYDAIEFGLKKVAAFCQEKGASVAMPRMGAGLARGDWSVIEGIIKKTLVEASIDVAVYDLPGQTFFKR